MPNCCVTGCHNRYYPGSTIRFYRVPSGNRQFQVQRRRLWMEAIQQANGSRSEIRADARICGVHFISGSVRSCLAVSKKYLIIWVCSIFSSLTSVCSQERLPRTQTGLILSPRCLHAVNYARVQLEGQNGNIYWLLFLIRLKYPV